MDYFVESNENCRLFLNYPMIEGIYHLKGIPDCSFKNRKVKKEDVLQHKYKSIVRPVIKLLNLGRHHWWQVQMATIK